MKRESARFLPDRLAAFAKKFHAAKYEAMDPEMLISLGMSSSKSEMRWMISYSQWKLIIGDNKCKQAIIKQKEENGQFEDYLLNKILIVKHV
ncbi:hypothetical protein AVEN_11124-1 [Araneus ventricosus]|uniref:Uncharacterized protein n=1 Tax=Araneus ventricosus TaxID=182803 RepID=A0A4Y2JHL0_ARAVE|nr:hypothetical protein AVEN_11124-1 [Araneus ventricosus]